MTLRAFRRGSALIVCTMVLVMASVMAVSLAAFSGANLQVADSQRRGNRAFAGAESGLEVMRYWLSRVKIPSSTAPSQYVSALLAAAQAELEDHAIDNFGVNPDGSIPVVPLDVMTGQSFQGQWSGTTNPTIMRATAVGASGGASRTITGEFAFVPYRFPIFNYGIATKGPLVLKYNPRFLAASEGWEADIYVESANSSTAVDITKNATFAGNIDIGNPEASVECGGTLNVGGDISALAEDDRPEFPVPNIEQFRQYATGPVIDASTNLSSGSLTFANAVIAAGTNPTFNANVTFQGVLYIESPNKVTFAKNTTLQGMIVAAGDVANPGTNQISFGDPTDPSTPSNFASGPYPAGEQFDALRNLTGSCILAPGFAVSFHKNFSAVNGVIAASGLYFANNATAAVKGTLINYSAEPTIVERNINLTFDRSSMVEVPAGFDLYRVPVYNPTSYTIVN